MKFILIALLCSGVALARIEEWSWLDQVSPNRKIEDSAFRNGREYHFFYNGQLSTGIAGASKQHSANRIQALVTVQFKSQNQVLMRLQNVRIGKLNREVPNPRKIMPFDAFEDVQIEQHLKQKLERTVKFSYVNGLVHDLVFDSHEDPWSANIKRGVLNMLQVNLQQQRRIDTAEETRLTNNPRYNRNYDDDKTNFYRVMENTLEGECETLYTIQEQPTVRHSNAAPVLNVTKSINFEKCNKRPQIKYNFRFADQCPTCESKYNDDEKFLKSSTVVKYNITGDKNAFLIEGARVDSEYIFTPFNEQANIIVTYVNQTLVLIKSGPAQSLPEPQNPIESDSDMVFALDWDVAYEKFHMKGDEQTHRQLHDSQQGLNKVELAKKFIQKIAGQQKEQLDEDNLQQLSRLVHLMRMSKEDELEQIYSTRAEATQEAEKKLQAIIPQALAICGTKHCTKLLTHKIRQGEITPLRAAFAIKGLLHNRVASKEIIAELEQLCESDKARESELLKRNCWLTVGSLINAACTANEDQLALETKESSEKLCPREQKEKYIKTLINKFRQANKWQDKVLMLKTIGNAGLDISIFELEKIIRQQDGSQPMYVRYEAILALNQMKETVPKKIQRILMPIILNRREYPTIRSTAAYILLQTKPERPILDQLAHNLITEPSHQFAAFVYTQMQSYANSTNPCEKQLATDTKLALRHAKKINSGIGYSRLSHLSLQSEQEKVGLDLDYEAIFSNISAIPRHLGLAIHANALGFWQKNLATLHLFNEGLEPLIRQYLDDDTVADWLNSESLDQLLSRHPRNTRNGNNEYQQELQDIFSKHLKIRTRDYSQEHQNEPKVYASATFKGQSVGLLPVTKELVQQLIQDAGSNLRQVEQKLRQGHQVDYTAVAQLHDMYYKIPTTLGLPLTISINAPVAWNLQGKIQANVESPKQFKVHAQLKPSAVAQLLFKVEAWSPIVSSGIKIKSKAKLFTPIDARLEIDLGTRPITIKAIVKPPQQKRDLLVLESRPVTYTQEWQRYARSANNEGQEEKTIMGEEQNRVNTFNKCFGRQSLGVDICARGQVHHTPSQSVPGTPFIPLSGPNKIVVTAEPSQDVPQEIEIKLSGKFQQLNANEIQTPSFDQFSILEDDDGYESDSEMKSSEQGSQEQVQQRRHGQAQQRRQQQQQNRRRQQQQQQQQLRSQRQGQTQRNTFQQVLQQYRSYQMKKGYKTQVQLEMQAGSNRKVQVELSHIYDSKQRYGQVQMKVQRQRPDQWEACLNAEMMFPERPQFAEQVKEKKILANAQLKWGQTCNSQNYIQLTTRAERSRQQAEWEKTQNQYEQYQSTKCQNKAWCSPLTQNDFVQKIAHMLKYRVDIDYQNVPQIVQNATNKLYRALKHYYYWQTDVDQITQNQQNKIKAEIILDAQTKQRLNVTLKTPKETINIQDMPLAQPLGVFNQKQSISEQVVGYMNDDNDQSECSIRSKNGWTRRSQVDTFDGVKFGAPFTNCWVVLAKDCGSEQPKFVVMARKSEISGSTELKEVKIITPRHRIQLLPESDEYESVKVEVNGRPYNPEIEDEIVENGQVIAKIDKDQSTVRVQLPKTGVEVHFDGYSINIKLSQYYRGQQCGLCGHYDLESVDEFRNPDFTEEQDLRQFYMNYLIKDGRCQAPKQLSEVCESEECDKTSSSSSSSTSSSSGSHQNSESNEVSENPEYKTKVIETDGQLCFSNVPVAQCDEDESYPVGQKEQKKVSYTCIDQDSQSAEEIERHARSGRRNIPALKNRTPTFVRMEIIPEKCQKYNRH